MGLHGEVNRGYDLSNQEEMPIEAITSLYQKIMLRRYTMRQASI